MRTGLQLRAYLALRWPLQALAPRLLRRRLARGKEDPARMAEKLGHPGLPRPDGRLIWLHAVGLGEVLALRPLIAALAEQDPALEFLITSTTRASAGVLAANLPPRCRHQFLPLDGPRFCRRFLAHWRPDLAIWAEQDLWPGMVHDAARAGVPQAYVNVRMTAAGHKNRRKIGGLFADVLSRFGLIAAQDPDSAARLRDLGAGAVRISGSLKPAAPPLSADPAALEAARAATAGRRVWLAASTHPADEAEVIPAAARLFAADPRRLLILAPRLPDRADAIVTALSDANLPFARRSLGQMPRARDAVWLADSFGEMGLWYRLAKVALVGGGFGTGDQDTGGHNPWEALCLGVPVLRGPGTHNFAADYALLDAAGLAVCIAPGDVEQGLLGLETSDAAAHAATLIAEARAALQPLARDLLALMEPR